MLAGLLSMLLAVSPACADDSKCETCSPGYWVVSTYAMPQHPGVCPKQYCFQVYRKSACGKLQRSSMSQLQHGVDPNAPTCIFVHGSFVDIDSALVDAHHTYGWLKQGGCGRPLNVIFFVWPSSDAETILLPTKVIENGLKAAHNGIYLSALVDSLPPSSPICMLGHSHGTRVIAAGLHFQGGGPIHGVSPPRRPQTCRRMRAVFAAAAINHTWMNPENRYGRALTQVDGVLNLINHRDAALTLYPLVSPTYGRSLAKTGLTNFDSRQLGPYANKVHNVNVSPIVGVRHVWSTYYTRPEVSRLISGYVYGPAGQRPHNLAVTPSFELPEDEESAGPEKMAIHLPLPEELDEPVAIVDASPVSAEAIDTKLDSAPTLEPPLLVPPAAE